MGTPKFLLEKYVNTNLNKKIIEWKFASFDDSLQSLLYFMIYNNIFTVDNIKFLYNKHILNTPSANVALHFNQNNIPLLENNVPNYNAYAIYWTAVILNSSVPF